MAGIERVMRPTHLVEYPWGSEEDLKVILEVIKSRGLMVETHEKTILTPAHIHFGDLKRRLHMVEGQSLIVHQDGTVDVANPDALADATMTLEEFDLLLDQAATNG